MLLARSVSLCCPAGLAAAVHREPAESWHTFSGSVFHPLSEVPEQTLAPPPGAGPQVRRTTSHNRLPAARCLPSVRDGCTHVGPLLHSTFCLPRQHTRARPPLCAPACRA